MQPLPPPVPAQREPMHIIELSASNVKRLKAVRIVPDGSMIRIEGRNGQGKSSVLDSIIWILGGAKHSDKQMLRLGTDKAAGRLDLGKITVERTLTAAGTTSLTVTAKDGERVPSPQAVLDMLVGTLTFDPLKFAAMKDVAQASELAKLVGIDLTDLDQQGAYLYEQRRDATREAKAAALRVPELPKDADKLPDEPVKVAELVAERDLANENNTLIETLRGRIQSCRDERVKLVEQIKKLEEMIAAGAEIEQSRVDLLHDLKPIDTAPLQAAIASADATNTLIRQKQAHTAAVAAASDAEAKAQGLDDAIQKCAAERKARLDAAKFPYPGLSLSDNGVLLNGVMFAQASSSEQLRASVAIGLAQHPDLRVMFVHDGSLLDNAAMADLARIAEENNAQVWVERVADTASPSAIVIEDGEVAGQS